MLSLTEKMLNQRKAISQTMTNQIKLIDDISSQSNNLLLEIESSRLKETNHKKDSPNKKAYKFSKKMIEVLPKAIELFERTNQHNDICADPSVQSCTIQAGFADFLHQNEHNNQYLSNNVRKTVFIAEILQKVVTQDDLPKGATNNIKDL